MVCLPPKPFLKVQLKDMKKMMKTTLGISVMFSLLAMGCNGENPKPVMPITSPVTAPEGFEFQAKDIAQALGMNGFLLKIPDNDDGKAHYGFTFISKNGVQPCGYSSFKAGETVRVIFWSEGDSTKVSMIGLSHAVTSTIDMTDLKKTAFMKTVSDPRKIYVPGEAVSIWSVGKTSDPGDGVKIPMRSTSLIFTVVKMGGDSRFQFNDHVDE